MARIRSIKPTFWTDAKIQRMTVDARLMYIGLWNYADDEGRFLADARLIKAAVFPIDDEFTLERITVVLRELCRSGRIIVWEFEGEHYGEIPNFRKHQVINKPGKSVLPSFRDHSGSATVLFTEDYRGEVGSRKWEVGDRKEELGGAEAPVFDPAAFDDESEDNDQPESMLFPGADEAPVSPVVLTFPCRGKPATWDLTEARVTEWRNAFPTIDVNAECKKALAWCQSNEPKQKKARGMPRFINGWLNGASTRRPQKQALQAGCTPQSWAKAKANNEKGIF